MGKKAAPSLITGVAGRLLGARLTAPSCVGGFFALFHAFLRILFIIFLFTVASTFHQHFFVRKILKFYDFKHILLKISTGLNIYEQFSMQSVFVCFNTHYYRLNQCFLLSSLRGVRQ